MISGRRERRGPKAAGSPRQHQASDRRHCRNKDPRPPAWPLILRRKYRLRRDNPYAQEKITDLDDRFEVYIPCGRYCRYYQARIKPVVGQYQQNVEVTGPRYRKSWKIPENVDIDGITQSTLPSGYLKLDIPKMHEQVKNNPSYEAPPRDAMKELETAKYAAYTNEYRWSHCSISEGSPKQEKGFSTPDRRSIPITKMQRRFRNFRVSGRADAIW